MNPQKQFCHNQNCWAYGRKGEEHIVIHSHKEKRYRCNRCRTTFTQTKGTALYRLHKPQELLFVVLTLLAYGSPTQAIVAAFDLDERTVSRWQKEAGLQCRRVHEHLVEAGSVELSQVQADELRVRVVGGVMWLATALEVGSRLWLGGVVRVHRDRRLIRALLFWRIRACSSIMETLFMHRQSGLLYQAGPPHLPGSFAHGKSGSPPANLARRGNGGEGQKAR